MARDAFNGAGGPAAHMPVHPACGLETLDRMGIDIDQDPGAFAKFLELRNLAMQRRRSAAPASPRIRKTIPGTRASR